MVETKSGNSTLEVQRRLPWGFSGVSEDERSHPAKLTEGWEREGGVCLWVNSRATAQRYETCPQINNTTKVCGRIWRKMSLERKVGRVGGPREASMHDKEFGLLL